MKATEAARQNLRAKMREQGKLECDLAEVLGVAPRTASDRVTGRSSLTLDEALVVKEWLGITLDELVTP